MEKTATVNEALRKGQIMLVYLPLIVIFSIIILCFILNNIFLLNTWIIPLGFITGLLSGWLTWSYFVNKWKIWAYQNVRNIHELQRKAIDQKLIWKDGSWFEKTEFKSVQQKLELESLKKNFLENDIYTDDFTVPEETSIFLSKSTLTVLLIINFGLFSLGLYLTYNKEYFGLFFIAIGLYLVFDKVKKLRDNEPQIIINDKGIQLKNEKLVKWNKIYHDKVFTKYGGKNSKNYLYFNHEMVELEELAIKFDELENLLNVYRMRSESNINH